VAHVIEMAHPERPTIRILSVPHAIPPLRVVVAVAMRGSLPRWWTSVEQRSSLPAGSWSRGRITSAGMAAGGDQRQRRLSMQFPKRVRRTFSTTVRLTAADKHLLDSLTTARHCSQSEVFALGLRCLAEEHGLATAQGDVPAEAETSAGWGKGME
jgi:hypothetical protein